MAILEGKDPKQKLQSTWLEAYKKNCMLWPAIQFVNFKYVPLQHRVLLVNFVSIGMLGPRALRDEQPLTNTQLRLELLPKLHQQ